MSKLIEDLLYYSKNVQDNEGKEVVNIEDALDAVLQMINPSSNVLIEKINLNHDVLFQPLAFHQIISNIVSNAIKYNDKEILKVRIYFDKENASLSFQDNGPGIPYKNYEDVFKPFFTLDPSRNKLKGESGLGLSITRDIIRSHGGEIKLDKSNIGGLKSIIQLPL